VEWPEGDLPVLGEGVYYQHDLIGLSVQTEDGDLLGSVATLLPTGANDVLVVRGERGEYLVPLIDDVVHRIDLETQTVIVELLPGLEPTPVAREHQRGRRARRTRTRAQGSVSTDGEAGPPAPIDGGTEEE
jgi:hypothetical protein